ncbi:MAG TPA: hypothetical protein VFF73_24755, partial [Planctomycetota bacterium]|nr:hypothetical protein [Planctomycetota bacterium]
LPAGLVALVVAQGIVSLVGAIGALRGQSWGRVVVAATGALGIAGSLMRGITDPASVMVLPLHVACLFLLAPSVGRWTTDEGRAAAKRFATRAYASIVLWVLLIFGWLLVETPLKEIFDNMSIELPWMAQVTLNAGAFLKDFGVLLPLAPPLIVLGFFPVLWVPTSHRRSVTIGINFIGPLVLAITVISIVLPIVKLRDSLGQ